MTDLILLTTFVLGWLALVGVGLLLLVFCLAMVWRIIRHVWGFKLIFEAIREHEKNHPEKWRRFNAADITR